MKFRSFFALLLCLLVLTGCTEAPAAPSDGSLLTVHFLDVGQADCALLECGDDAMLIDGGNVADSDFVVNYLDSCGIEELTAVICTHAHEDHVGGLAGVLAVFPTETVYAPTRVYSSDCFDNFRYYVDQQGLEITIPAVGDAFSLGDARVTVLGPGKDYPDTNNTSIVTRVEFGDTSFLFTGDMELEAENDMLEAGLPLRSDVLKVGHHGSSTSTSYRFLYTVDPSYAVISCGRGNSYGHPHKEVTSRLRDAEITTFRTDTMGTVLAVSDGETVTFTWEKSGSDPENPDQSEIRYIGNRNSKKFHLPSCSSLPAEKNRVYFASREEALEAGFTPCGSCMPK